jgi:hypothetical protein
VRKKIYPSPILPITAEYPTYMAMAAATASKKEADV